MSEPKPADPSMDEILASIRRIVTDEEAADRVPVNDGVTPAVERDVLVLTDKVPNPEVPTQIGAKLQPAPASEPLVSDTAHAATASAFDKLAAVRGEVLVERQGPLLATPGRTLEDLTQDLLRPIIKDWLDANLPTIVQERVDEEIARIARGRARPA